MHWSPLRTCLVSLTWLGLVLSAIVVHRQVELGIVLLPGLLAIAWYGCQPVPHR